MKAKIIFTFPDASTLEVLEDKIIQNGVIYSRSSTSPSAFEIGGAKADEVEIMLNNISHFFDNYELENSEFQLFFYNSGWESAGYFKTNSAPYSGSLVNVHGYNRMVDFETPFINIGITAPVTLGSLLSQICTYCGISLATTTFTNSTRSIPRLPDSDSLSCRAMVSYIAQMSGNYAYINELGQLALGWYTPIDMLDGNGEIDIIDGNGLADIIDGNPDFNYENIYDLKSAEIELSDIIITGLEVHASGTESDYGESYMSGTDGYVLVISDNPLITEGTAESICESIAPYIVGLQFRPMTINTSTNKIPALGSYAYVSFRGQEYYTYINDFTYTLNVGADISCYAEPPLTRLTNKGDGAATALRKAEEKTKLALSKYDQQIQLLTNIMTYAFGAYPTQEKQSDGSTIYYLHDKPLLADSTNIWKMTALAFAVSSDGGNTWNAGLDSNGQFTAASIATGLLSADLIKTGSLYVGDTGADEFICTFNSTASSQYKTVRVIANSEGFKIQQLNVVDESQTWTTLFDSGYLYSSVSGARCVYAETMLFRQIGHTSSDDYWVAGGDMSVSGGVSASSFTDRTPHYDGNALEEIAKIKGKNGEIDHSTLPEFARKDIVKKEKRKKEKKAKKSRAKTSETTEEFEEVEVIEEGRDLGAMISILTKGMQELIEKIETLEQKIEKQQVKIEKLEEAENGN
jgi:hypothetical protein